MNTNFVNRKDRIVASAIEIISEMGLASLTTKTLAMKENMSESLLYRYFGGIEEVLVEVINTFTKFDSSIVATIEAKDISHFDKVLEFIKTFSIYYNGYKELAAIILNYEEFLHNVNTREAIAGSIEMRSGFLKKEFEAAIREKEIIDTFTPEELTNIFMGGLDRDLLNRRIQYGNKSHNQYAQSMIDKMADLIRIKPDS